MWFLVALFVAGFVLTYARQPKIEQQKPAGFDELQAPVAEENIELPVVFGTHDIKGPNCVDYGNLRTVAVTKKSGGKK